MLHKTPQPCPAPRRENLAFSARLKLPRSVSRNDVDAIIDETLDMLDLEHLRHSRTGSVERRCMCVRHCRAVSCRTRITGAMRRRPHGVCVLRAAAVCV